MRKVSLEMNLGKKSMARFPRRVQNNLKLKLIANASEAEPLPPLGPSLTLCGVNARGFCEDFNHNSKDYDIGFPVSINLFVTATKSYYYEFRSPSCFNLFNRCFDFVEASELPKKIKLILLCCLNITLIKNLIFNEYGIFYNKMNTGVKQILGSLRSYGFKFKKINKSNSYNKKIFIMRKNIHLLNSKFTSRKL